MKEEYYQEFLCGYGAAATSICITYPLNKVIFRQMLHGVVVRRAIEQLKTEGILSLFRGVLPPLLQKSTSLALMFGIYNQIYRNLSQSTPEAHPLVHFAYIWPSAASSSAVECFLVPLERIQTLLQDRKYHCRFHNTFHAAKELYAYGFREYYRGFTAIYLRNTFSTGLFFSLREPIANGVLKILQQRKTLPSEHLDAGHLVPQGVANFTSGAILGAALSTIFYPVNVVRAHMQSYVGGPFHSIAEIWKSIRCERRSIFAIWRGVPLNFSRSLISWGIINASYELFKKLFFKDSVPSDSDSLSKEIAVDQLP